MIPALMSAVFDQTQKIDPNREIAYAIEAEAKKEEEQISNTEGNKAALPPLFPSVTSRKLYRIAFQRHQFGTLIRAISYDIKNKI